MLLVQEPHLENLYPEILAIAGGVGQGVKKFS